jgi:hypothetical protein
MLVKCFVDEIVWFTLLLCKSVQSQNFRWLDLYESIKDLIGFWFSVVLLCLKSIFPLESIKNKFWLILYDFYKISRHWFAMLCFCYNFIILIQLFFDFILFWDFYAEPRYLSFEIHRFCLIWTWEMRTLIF